MVTGRIGAALLLVLAALSLAHAEAPAVPEGLSREVLPLSYHLRLDPHPDTLRFDGEVVITIRVLKETRRITLNAAELDFRAAALESAAGASRVAEAIEPNGPGETASLRFKAAIAPGTYRLRISYSGHIATQAHGLFALDYPTATGTKRALYTQFEASDARRLFPGWDEPAYKATFTLEARAGAGELAVSNMPVRARKRQGGAEWVFFAPTPRMSTYLLFYAAGDFERLSVKSHGVDIGVVTRRGAGEQAAFVRDATREVLSEYTSYFGLPYPLPKLDGIAAPGQSQYFGAMENWGAILTFEYAILLDPRIASVADRERAYRFAAHEIAHQWFGDLVTMRWWDDLWLNESFASWMESRTTARLHPEWESELEGIETRERAMARDALPTTHPIVQHLATVDEIDQAFDAITYSKGESVIGMLESYVGSEPWRRGVGNYLRAHRYGSAESKDLWSALEHASRAPIVQVAHDFTEQAGVPLIRVDAKCEGGETQLRLSQGEFTRAGEPAVPRRWHVPVEVRALGAVAAARVLVAGGAGELRLPGCGPVLVNAGQRGYFRTLYTRETLRALAGRLAEVAPADQLGLVHDAWSLYAAGLAPPEGFVALLGALPANAPAAVWRSIAEAVRDIDSYYGRDGAGRAAFRRYAAARLSPVLARVGWEAKDGELPSVAIAREGLVRALASIADPATIAEARRRLERSASDPGALPAAIRKTVLAAVARHADAPTWERLHGDARAERTPLVRDYLYLVLAVPEDPVLAARALELAITDEPGATNAAEMIRQVSRQHPEQALDFVLAHKQAIAGLIDGPARTTFIADLLDYSADPAAAERLRRYGEGELAPESRHAIQVATDTVAYRARVRERLPLLDAELEKGR
jgi:aminopeptidase N